MTPTSRGAQNTDKNSKHGCFALHVRLNGKPLDDPRTITPKTKDTETTLLLQGGCFIVPPALLREKTLDVTFTVPKIKYICPTYLPAFSDMPGKSIC